MQHLTTQNIVLVELVKTQQKNINKLLKTSKNMIETMQILDDTPTKQIRTANKETSLQLCKHCNKQKTDQDDDCYHLDKNKDKRPQ